MNNELKINMRVLSSDNINMKLDDTKIVDANITGGIKEVDPIFINSPAYTITYEDISIWNHKSNFSGSYNDLTNKPFIPTQISQLTNDLGFITKNVNNLTNYTLTSNLSSVATTGDYDDLINKPTIPSSTSDLENNSGFITNTVDNLTNYTLSTDLSTVATTGDYSDLINKPNLSTVAISGLYQDLINKPTLSTVASTGDYDDLINKPTIPVVPTNVSSFNNDAGYITNTVNDLTNYTLSSNLATVATSGDYNDLINKPSGLTLDSTVSTTSTNGIENQAITNYVNKIGTIKQGFGDIFTSDGTYTGTLYSNVVGKNIGNGIWEITTDGQIAYSNAGSNYYDYGLSVTKIGNLLGLNLSNPVSGNTNLYSKYYFYNSSGQIDRGIAGYGPIFEYHSNINCLMPARIYNTNGDIGGWPMNMFTSGGYLTTTIYLKEQ